MRVKISQFAKENGLSYRTIWNYVKAGLLPFITTPTGTILIDKEKAETILQNNVSK